MTITYPLSLPAVSGRRQINFRQKTVVAVSRSPFTGQRQVQVHPGQWWEADVTMPPMIREVAEEWISFAAKLNGPQGTLLMGDPLGAVPRGLAGGLSDTLQVKGAGQTGSSLLFDGATISLTGYLLSGDWLQISSGASSRLHKVLANANSNGAGEVTVDIWPRLRSSPADNAAVTPFSAKGVFSLPPGVAAEWSQNEQNLYTMSFSVQEVI